MRVVPQKRVEEVETHVRGLLQMEFGYERFTSCLEDGCLFEVCSVWGAEMHAPIRGSVKTIGIATGTGKNRCLY